MRTKADVPGMKELLLLLLKEVTSGVWNIVGKRD